MAKRPWNHYTFMVAKLLSIVKFLIDVFSFRLAEILRKRWQQPWLWPDCIFNNVPLGREHNRLLRILHGFTDKVRDGSALQ